MCPLGYFYQYFGVLGFHHQDILAQYRIYASPKPALISGDAFMHTLFIAPGRDQENNFLITTPTCCLWRHRMETFSALLAFCARNSPVSGEYPAQRPVTRSFGVFFDLRLNKRSSKQSGRQWLETPLRPLWRHCNVKIPLNNPCCLFRRGSGKETW